jgi:hypothetical protein
MIATIVNLAMSFPLLTLHIVADLLRSILFVHDPFGRLLRCSRPHSSYLFVIQFVLANGSELPLSDDWGAPIGLTCQSEPRRERTLLGPVNAAVGWARTL